MKRAGIIWLFVLLWLPLQAQSRRVVQAEGSPHVLTLLVEFRNVRFSIEEPQAHFTQMLNGQVQEYFRDNSQGRFTPRFDVYGPVLLDAPMADYGRDIVIAGERIGDYAPEKALTEACALLDEEADFARYDADSDGVADMVLIYYAGFDQAAGGPSDAIWSHHLDIQESDDQSLRDAAFDGVRLGYYFCTSELRGNQGTHPVGIGSTVHEMGHVLGLPDFYDTNAGEDGYAGGLYQFSPMSLGMYNDDGDTPPRMGALERILLGWMEEKSLQEFGEGWQELGPVQQQTAFFSRTATEGEFFIYEFRDGTLWDAPLPMGLVVYHVDQSEREVGGIPARDLWTHWRTYNNLNNRGDHPCYYVVPPMAPKDYYYAPAANLATLVFPGVGEVRCFHPRDWENTPTGVQISCIDLLEGKIRFRVLRHEGGLVSGLVLDASHLPVEGVSVQLFKEGGSLIASARTAADGYFQLLLKEWGKEPLVMTVEKNGYRTVNQNITLSDDGLFCQFVHFFAHEDPSVSRLSLYDPSLSAGYFHSPEPLIGAVRFSAEQLAPYAGQRLSQVVCFPYITEPEETGRMYVTVDMAGERVLNQLVENPKLGEYLPVNVSLTDANLRIPEGLDIYVGYGFEGQGSNYPLSAVYPGTQGNSYYAPFSLETLQWKPLFLEQAGFYMDLMLETVLEEVPASKLPEMGYSCIDVRKGPYKAGEQLNLSYKVPQSVRVLRHTWLWDGERLQGTSVQLRAGEHTLELRLEYADGREEYLGQILQVN